MREGERAPSRGRREDQISFQHTQLGVYLAGAFGLVYLWSSSAQVTMPETGLHITVIYLSTCPLVDIKVRVTCSRMFPPAAWNLGT
jgi:hypothetical protein